jgi:segregation and condensation protein A
MENEADRLKEEAIKEVKENPSNLQVYSIVTGRDPSWQSIIYELISSEQMDPWNIDISVLCRSYFERIRELEENNFHVSSKILLAAALLLRIKSEVLLNKYIRDIDKILFNEEEEVKKIIERIELNEDEIPVLSPKTPLPRFKQVTLQELIDSLDVAIKTESRRIEKEIQKKQAERMSHVDIPKFKRINIKDRIRRFYAKILTAFKSKKAEMKLPYSSFTGDNKEEKIACFLPMLHLSNTGKLWLEQEKHFSEIWLYLYEVFKKNFPEHDKEIMEENIERENWEGVPIDQEVQAEMEEQIDGLKKEMKEMKKELDDEQLKRVEEINKDFENPVGDLISGEAGENEFS